MLLQEEFSRLIYMYQQASEGLLDNVEEVFRKSLDFVEHLKLTIKNGDEEDRAAALKMMRELFSHMQKQTKIVCEKTGITEQQLMANSENPANFTPEQWRSMQEAKGRLAKAGAELSQVIHEKEPVKQEALPSGPASVRPPESKKKPDVKVKRAKRSDWKRM